MERRFDATLKSMLEDSPEDWPRLVGIAEPRVLVIDADISTVSGAADKVLRLEGPSPFILHFEFQSGPDASLPCDVNVYNSVLEKRHGLPVRSVVVVLSPRAELAVVNGEYTRHLPGAPEPYRLFRYEVVRVWQLPASSLLAGGLGTLPLAPISNVAQAELPAVIGQMKKRLAPYADRRRVGRLWTAVTVLLGLRYEPTIVERLLEGVLGMEESTTYQAIVAKGRIEGRSEGAREELRKVLLKQGEERFRTPPPDWAAPTLEQIDNLEQLEALATRLLRAKSWSELLPRPRKPPRRKKNGA